MLWKREKERERVKITARCKIGRVLEKEKNKIGELLEKARPWSAILAQTFSVLF